MSSRGVSSRSWEVRVGQLARLQEVEVLELVEARPEVEEVEHGAHGGVRGLADDRERRGERGEVGRRAGELDHRGQPVLLRDVARLADAVGGGREVVRGDGALRDRRRVDQRQAQLGKLFAAPPPRLERRLALRPRQPEVLQDHRRRHRRQVEVLHQAPRRRQRVGPQEIRQQRRPQLDVADAGARPIPPASRGSRLPATCSGASPAASGRTGRSARRPAARRSPPGAPGGRFVCSPCAYYSVDSRVARQESAQDRPMWARPAVVLSSGGTPKRRSPAPSAAETRLHDAEPAFPRRKGPITDAPHAIPQSVRWS